MNAVTYDLNVNNLLLMTRRLQAALTPDWKWIKANAGLAVITGMVNAMGYFLLFTQIMAWEPNEFGGVVVNEHVALTMILAMAPGALLLDKLLKSRFTISALLATGLWVIVGAILAIYSPLRLEAGLVFFVAQWIFIGLVICAVEYGLCKLADLFFGWLERWDVRRTTKQIGALGADAVGMFNSMATMELVENEQSFWVLLDREGNQLARRDSQSAILLKAKRLIMSELLPDQYAKTRRFALFIGLIGLIATVAMMVAVIAQVVAVL